MMSKFSFISLFLVLSLLSTLSWSQKDESASKPFDVTSSKPKVLEATSVWVELTDKTTLPLKQANGSFSAKNESMLKLLQSFKISKASLAFSHSKRPTLKNI
jgi:hypothetical protein